MKPKQITGRGRPPRELKAALGQKYRDERTNKLWLMGPNGWEMATFLHVELGDRKEPLHIEPLIGDKIAWRKAAATREMSLEDWVIDTLNQAAEAIQRINNSDSWK